MIDWPKATSRGAKRRVGRGLEKGFPSPGMGVRGVTPGQFWNLRRNLVQSGAFGKKLTVLQFSTFANENIAMLDSVLLT